MPRTQVYDADTIHDNINLYYKGDFDEGLKAAIYKGFFAPVTESDIDSSCATGNCTFTNFDSLAFCSSCKNFSPDHINVHSSGGESGTLIYTLPNISSVKTTLTLNGSTGSGPGILSTPFMGNMSGPALGVPNPLVAFSLLRFPEADASIGPSGLSTAFNYSAYIPDAWACALYFCVNIYTANITDGKLSSHVASSWYNSTGIPFPLESSDELDNPGGSNAYSSLEGQNLNPPANATCGESDPTFSIS
ncbi:hypothetical protein MMC10_011142 [Thelotrema lepadinum]|nr:hypothetical protein [Thelotrema lepadinum]